MELHITPFNLLSVIEDIGEQLQGQAESKNIDLIIDYPHEFDKYFLGDPGLVRQIIVNIVSNAIKFTSEGHVLIQVRCSRDSDDISRVQIEIKDTGIGDSEHIVTLSNLIDCSVYGLCLSVDDVSWYWGFMRKKIKYTNFSLYSDSEHIVTLSNLIDCSVYG